MTITVHLVLNAHIDPVWLWPWQSGADEVLATCRSACDRLDRHPDIVFTRGEAWAYDLVERLDPALFRRIRSHVSAGRWEVVGGWWLQPDCNQPSAAGLDMQIRLGRSYFLDRFGCFPRVGYNVDSFGHAALLPSLMRSHGQDRYVMMRPQPHELSLPARVFRWRTEESGEEVTTFRIARNYETGDITRDHVLASLQDLPPGVTHTMCFVGVGDHGGGPTERQIAWCRENRDAIPGCRLVFSSPSRYFDAVAAQSAVLPLVTGELQHHAVGCYSVMRSVKASVRRAEHLLQQAAVVSRLDAVHGADQGASLDAAWRRVCFAHFHDTLGGTCIASAYLQIEDQLGYAKTCADEILQLGLRRRLPGLTDDERQRIVLCNAADLPFDGYTVLAPWIESVWQPSWRVIDEAGEDIPYQLMSPEAVVNNFAPRLILRVCIGPAQIRALTVDRVDTGIAASRQILHPAGAQGADLTGGGCCVDLHAGPVLRLPRAIGLPIELALCEDSSDTWGHGVERFDGSVIAAAQWDRAIILDRGPLMAAALQLGSIGDSDLRAEWRTYAGEPLAELLLSVHWRARQQVLKLVLPVQPGIRQRIDGTPGMALRRELDGKERPVRDFTLLELADGDRLGLVIPDIFALDSDRHSLRLTLLRSPFVAHHAPARPRDWPRAEIADQGVHAFRIIFAGGPEVTTEWLEQRASMLNFPLLSADWTRGMSPDGTPVRIDPR